jgi:hypothetical protein
MATWRFDFQAIKVLGADQNGWPITELLVIPYKYTGHNMQSAISHAPVEGKSEILQKGYIDPIILGFERVDKPNDKGFISLKDDYYYEQHDEPLMPLSAKQGKRLEQIQQNIIDKLPKIEASAEINEVELGDFSKGALHFWVNGDRPYLLTHEDAQKIILLLERFYKAITPEELSILDIGKHVATHSQLVKLRAFDKG